MALELFYITNRPMVAQIAQQAGVDRIFLDMECIGKEERQAGMDTVKCSHTINDAVAIRRELTSARLMVRVNPIHKAVPGFADSREEIDRVLDAGADIIMLPMYRTVNHVEEFLRIVDGRAKTTLLAETPESCDVMDEVLKIAEVDELHIGLNDLHLAYHKKFMFELLADGTVDAVCAKIKASGKPFGFGGIARIGYGMLPAEYVIGEHYRIGSTRAILSRSFCNADKIEDIETVRDLFVEGLAHIRETEKRVSAYGETEFRANREEVVRRIEKIVSTL
ncbi:MAG: aldolase [Clostridia bacterium]|nr:aldolase [Clostridia bacterium]